GGRRRRTPSLSRYISASRASPICAAATSGLSRSGCFFLSSASSRRVPRSFPTRRSSDLVGPLLNQVVAGHHLLQGIGAQGVDARDRKSTRLNSSHVSISYAVFCLKKKNH